MRARCSASSARSGDWSARDFVVDADDGRVFVLYNVDASPFGEAVEAYTLDRSPLSNLSFDAVTPPLTGI